MVLRWTRISRRVVEPVGTLRHVGVVRSTSQSSAVHSWSERVSWGPICRFPSLRSGRRVPWLALCFRKLGPSTYASTPVAVIGQPWFSKEAALACRHQMTEPPLSPVASSRSLCASQLETRASFLISVKSGFIFQPLLRAMSLSSRLVTPCSCRIMYLPMNSTVKSLHHLS